MDVRLTHVELSEAGHSPTRHPFAFPVSEDAKTAFEFDLAFERDLGSSKKTHCHVWFSDCGETPRQAIGELCCHQLVSNLGWTSGNAVQTVVTHGDELHVSPPRRTIARCAHCCQSGRSVRRMRPIGWILFRQQSDTPSLLGQY